MPIRASSRSRPLGSSRRRLLVLVGLILGGLAGAGMVAPAAPGGGEFPDDWFYKDRKTGKRYELPATLEGKPAPALKATRWIGPAQSLDRLKGKVVVVDFWATWCGPCMRAIPKNVELARKYRDYGLQIIGIHDSKRGHERMPAVAKAKNIDYPLAVDDAGKSTKAWRVSFWPTYVVIDRTGTVRAAGIRPDHVEDVVKKLLEEKSQAK